MWTSYARGLFDGLLLGVTACIVTAYCVSISRDIASLTSMTENMVANMRILAK